MSEARAAFLAVAEARQGCPYVPGTDVFRVQLDAAEIARIVTDVPCKPLWTLKVPAAGMTFLTSNAARRNVWQRNATAIKAWRSAAHLRARGDRTMPRLQAAHIVITAHHRDHQRRDAANMAPTGKAVVDGLVQAGLLPDDDDAHLIGPDYRTGEPVGRRGVPFLEVAVYAITPPASAWGPR